MSDAHKDMEAGADGAVAQWRGTIADLERKLAAVTVERDRFALELARKGVAAARDAELLMRGQRVPMVSVDEALAVLAGNGWERRAHIGASGPVVVSGMKGSPDDGKPMVLLNRESCDMVLMMFPAHKAEDLRVVFVRCQNGLGIGIEERRPGA